MKPTHLIFVYNAASGIFNLAADIAHKIFSPQTYPCRLCAITYGNFGMRGEWRDYLKTLQASFEFLHADEFHEKYDFKNAEFPAVFGQMNGELDLLIGAAEINACRDLSDLKNLINAKKS